MKGELPQMTTRIHIVNFGPDIVDINAKNPESGELNAGSIPSLGAQQSTDVYVHSSQSVEVSERKPQQNS